MATIRIPTPLRKYTQGQDSIDIGGGTVKELIENLESAHPGIKERICDDSGAVRRFVSGTQLLLVEDGSFCWADGGWSMRSSPRRRTAE